QKIKFFRPGAWLAEEVTSLQVSDDCHLGCHLFDSEVDDCQAGNEPSITPSRSDSTALRVTEDLTDHQVSDVP
ncbi:hypothetical protein HAX54_039118, partial [Datura stramonium]|nr:hypothetical protein [Datura stramonium]